MANLIPQIAEMLGVEIGEEFKVNLNGWEKIYRFNNNGLFGEIQTEKWIACPELFGLLVTGNAKIVKLPWQPKKGETYYTFELVGGKWIVHLLWWAGTPSGYALLDKGWLFRTQEEAEAALPKVAAELGVNYAL